MKNIKNKQTSQLRPIFVPFLTYRRKVLGFTIEEDDTMGRTRRKHDQQSEKGSVRQRDTQVKRHKLDGNIDVLQNKFCKRPGIK